MGIQHTNGDEPKMKTLPDGTRFDPAEKARTALVNFRKWCEGVEGPCDLASARHEALNAIGDRLQTCDALEHLAQKRKP